jgi:LacI family repressor for deo operon, udp, cdd, tsx, nupC, and nupG
MTTIFDVAQRAGVSKSTVSRVLTNSSRVDLETKQRVLEAVKALDYQPSRAAQTLRNKKTKLIAVLVPRIANQFFASLLEGMEREAVKHDYQVVLCNTEGDSQKELKFLKMLEHHQFDGMAFTAFRSPIDSIVQYTSFGPIILVEEYTQDNLLPTVTINHQAAAYQATEHLIKLGHQSLGMINGPIESVISQDREKGFRQALEDYNLRVNEKWLVYDSFGIEQGKLYLQKLGRTGFYPTAVFAGNDELAVGVIQQAKAQGLNVPHDLAIVGFDDQEIATVIEPQLTTVRQPIEQLGEQAMALLIDALQGKQTYSDKLILDTQLIIRASCGAR